MSFTGCTCWACEVGGRIPPAVLHELHAAEAARIPKPRAGSAQKGTTMPRYTPSAGDVAESKRMHERAEQLRVVDPSLSYLQAVMRASEQLARSEGISDPDHVLLTSMAQRWAIEHGVDDFGKAFRAVGAEYEALVAPAPANRAAATALAERSSEDLDRATRRQMRGDPKLSYRDALLLESAKTPARPSDRIATPAEPVEDPAVSAYATAHGLDYAAALLALAKSALVAGEV